MLRSLADEEEMERGGLVVISLCVGPPT
jgi:hypothetical protein